MPRRRRRGLNDVGTEHRGRWFGSRRVRQPHRSSAAARARFPTTAVRKYKRLTANRSHSIIRPSSALDRHAAGVVGEAADAAAIAPGRRVFATRDVTTAQPTSIR
ncbi:MAG: hypothetical protein D6725_09410 [Planctomycetota bacterium]|nr:MAG: hypothetical protein D6725_09410 [Planctomycetota bacterium]